MGSVKSTKMDYFKFVEEGLLIAVTFCYLIIWPIYAGRQVVPYLILSLFLIAIIINFTTKHKVIENRG